MTAPLAPDRNRQRAAAYLRRARVHLAGLRAIRAEIDATLDGPRPMQVEAERATERLLLRMLRYAGQARALARRAAPMAALALVLGAWTEPPRTMAGRFSCDVERVIDGDTIVCGDGRHIRLRGVDTPERGEARYREARVALSRMLFACRHRVEVDPHHRSRDRIVGTVLCGGVDLGRAMDADGWSKPVGARR